MPKKILIVIILGWSICLVSGSLWTWARQIWEARADADQTELRVARNLYDARLYREAIAECHLALSNVEYSQIHPQLLYIEWASERNGGDIAAASATSSRFLSLYPQNDLAADLRFAGAMDVMAAGDYHNADAMLADIQRTFPASPLDRKISNVRDQISENLPAISKTREVSN